MSAMNHSLEINTNDQGMVEDAIECDYKCRYKQLKHALCRDLAFLFLGILSACIVSYVETNAWDESSRWNPGRIINDSQTHSDCTTSHIHIDAPITDDNRCVASNYANDDLFGSFQISEKPPLCIRSAAAMPCNASATAPQKIRIIDAGFVLTNPLHQYLTRNRHINDMLAMINSLCLIVPFLYVVYVTVWNGDFTLSFRLIWVHLFRSLCGWFTYLPPDPEFLPSRYDFPEVIFCLFRDCTEITNLQQSSSRAVPFVTFFSGHIASVIIIANHLYVYKDSNDRNYTAKSYNNRNKLLSTSLHVFNWLQILRLLATRGHYSIDLIVGYIVAVFVSSFADRFGWCYSHGVRPRLPTKMVEVWEVLIGVGSVDLNGLKYEFAANFQDGSEKVRCLEAKSMKYRIGDCWKENRSMSMDDNIENNRVRSKTSVRMVIDIFAEYALKDSFWSDSSALIKSELRSTDE